MAICFQLHLVFIFPPNVILKKPQKPHLHHNETPKSLKPQTNEIFRWVSRLTQHTYSI